LAISPISSVLNTIRVLPVRAVAVVVRKAPRHEDKPRQEREDEKDEDEGAIISASGPEMRSSARVRTALQNLKRG
jgi:hypothetical protein